jgi:hypothetical protein
MLLSRQHVTSTFSGTNIAESLRGIDVLTFTDGASDDRSTTSSIPHNDKHNNTAPTHTKRYILFSILSDIYICDPNENYQNFFMKNQRKIQNRIFTPDERLPLKKHNLAKYDRHKTTRNASKCELCSFIYQKITTLQKLLTGLSQKNACFSIRYVEGKYGARIYAFKF